MFFRRTRFRNLGPYFRPMGQRWNIQYFQDESGHSPFLEWSQKELGEEAREWLHEIIHRRLVIKGPDLSRTKWLSIIHYDLYQLRIIKNEKRGRQKILLRIYLCFETDNQITLLSGYDKGADPSRERQTEEIQKALNFRDEWRARNA